jgi:hypothetical protein
MIPDIKLSLKADDRPGDLYEIDWARMVKRYNPTGQSLFSIEKRILEKLSHPGTVKLLGVYESDDDRSYFILKKPT